MEKKLLRFHVTLHRVSESYVARIVEFPGCIARGTSEVEAIENARLALREFLSVSLLLGAEPALVQVEISA